MRLATCTVDGSTRLMREVEGGLLDVSAAKGGTITDVGALLRAGSDSVAAVAAADEGPLFAEADVVFAPPVLAPGKIVCIGLNYRRHAQEGGVELPDKPVIFAKYANTLVGHGAPVPASPLTAELDYEAELAVVIGRRARNVPVGSALEFVAGYANANDVSARDLQHGSSGGQWTFGKSLDGFCPMGPYVVTPEAAGAWSDIRVRAWINGELRQDELCGDMVFGVDELIAYVSSGMTLQAGDVILTGTPSGVGLGFDPPKWLHPGDLMEIELSGLGRLANPVRAI